MTSSETGKWTLMSGLLEREGMPLVLILSGAVAVVVGLAGGVSYHSWLEIKELWARLVTCLLSVVPGSSWTRTVSCPWAAPKSTIAEEPGLRTDVISGDPRVTGWRRTC